MLIRFAALFLLVSLHNSVVQSSTKWEPLTTGDEVHLVVPSAPSNDKVREKFVQCLGEYEIKAYFDIESQDPGKSPFGYYAHQEDVRTSKFLEALEGDRKIIWALRGGYGAQEVLRSLLAKDFGPQLPTKLFCGFSDETALGLGLYNKFNWPWLHCQAYYCKETFSISNASVNKEASLYDVVRILKGEISEIKYTLAPLNDSAQNCLLDNSSILGGNLSVIQRNYASTLKNIDWSHKIFFLEDTTEDPKRALDILCGMFDSGSFKDIDAVLFGTFPIGTGKEEETKAFIEQFNKYLQRWGPTVPIYQYNRIGHGIYNDPLPMGTLASIQNNVLTVKTNH